MEPLLWKLIRFLRPYWLAFFAATTPSLAASDSALNLPARSFFWAGILGVVIGFRGQGSGARVQGSGVRRQTLYRFTVLPFYRFIALPLLGAAFVLGALDALPPLGLVAQDLEVWLAWAGQVWREGRTAGIPPLSRALVFLMESLPRVWRMLEAAPNAGEAGARVLVAAGGVALTWIGSLALGWALATRRNTFGWGWLLLAALLLTTLLGGAGGLPLAMGLGALLLLAIANSFQRRADAWERSGTDFSSELGIDALVWGGALVGAAMLVAVLLPAWRSPLASALWSDIEVPSGLAALDRGLDGGRPSPVAEIGLSSLPALQLGRSLEQGPPEQPALRVRLDAPLAASPWPRYWRARVFNIYTGWGWTTNARVAPLEPLDPAPGVVPDAIVQEVDDLRADRLLLIGLPDVLAVNLPANAERLPDGALAAVTTSQPADRYRVISRPQELAELSPPDRPPPNMRAYLALPRGLPPRVLELAHAVAGDRPGPYEQALAIESYLRGLPYSYQVAPLPRDGDAVDQFLFEMRSGYCTYYASAMAIMARSLGIPARVASGYATGALEAPGVYLVREADAHAWPELSINGRWLPFEPTPIRPLPERSREALPNPLPVPIPEQPTQPARPLAWLVPLALIALLVAAWLWLRRRPPSLVTRIQLRLEREGARAGVPWPPGATLHEYAELLAAHRDGARNSLAELIELVELARYSGRELREDELRRLRTAGDRVWASLTRKERATNRKAAP